MTFVPYVIDRRCGLPAVPPRWACAQPTGPVRSSDGGERAYDLYSRMLEERIVFCQGMVRCGGGDKVPHRFARRLRPPDRPTRRTD